MSDRGTKLLFSVGAVVLIGIRTAFPSLLPADAITLGLLIAAILPWIPSFINTAEFPGGWKFQFRELAAEQKQQKSEINALKFLIGHFITKDELVHLKKLSIGEAFPYKKASRFVAELRRLRDFGLIERTSSTGIGEIPEEGELTNFLKITEPGRSYLQMRQQVES